MASKLTNGAMKSYLAIWALFMAWPISSLADQAPGYADYVGALQTLSEPNGKDPLELSEKQELLKSSPIKFVFLALKDKDLPKREKLCLLKTLKEREVELSDQQQIASIVFLFDDKEESDLLIQGLSFFFSKKNTSVLPRVRDLLGTQQPRVLRASLGYLGEYGANPEAISIADAMLKGGAILDSSIYQFALLSQERILRREKAGKQEKDDAIP